MMIFVIVICLLAVVYSFIEPFWIQVKADTIASREVPKNFDRVKIIFISDIHLGPFFSKARVEKLVDRINEMEPDLILLGGDYVQKYPIYAAPCFEALKNLRAPMGVYGVMGNHDHYPTSEICRNVARKADITLLDNGSLWINRGNERIKLGGVGDIYADKQDIKATISDVDINDYVILLSHSPDYVEHMKTKKVDLMLSGHTHGGQCTLFGLWAPVVPSEFGNKYRTGIFKTEKCTLLVSNGIGASPPPMRFFARPQINVIYLKHEE